MLRTTSVTIATQLNRLSEAVNRFLMLVLSVVIIATLVVAFYGVIARFVLHNAVAWNEEVDAYLFIWLTFLGAGIVFREGAHPAIVVIVDTLPLILRRICSITSDLVVLTVGLVFVVYGIQTIQIVGDSSASSFAMPMRFPYLAVPIGGAILSLYALAAVAADIAGTRQPIREVVVPLGSSD